MVCASLGTTSGEYIEKKGGGVGEIWMEGVTCAGDEAGIHACPFHGWRNTECTHYEDVGVRCFNPCVEENEIRLVNPDFVPEEEGDTPASGRVEICHDGQWGKSCYWFVCIQ